MRAKLIELARRIASAFRAAYRAFLADWRAFPAGVPTDDEVPIPAQLQAVAYEDPNRFRVIAENRQVYCGPSGTVARKCAEKHQDPSKCTEVILTDRGVVRLHWKRGW